MKGNHALKILMPVVHYPPVVGGFEVFCENIAERVGSHIPYTVLTGKVAGVPRHERKGELEVRREASLWDLRDTSASSYLYILTSLPILFFKSLRIMRQENITLLHGNGFFNGLVCFLLHKITSVPYVMTIQSADFTIYHPGRLYKLISSIQSSVERAIYRNAAVCHAVSHDLCGHFKSQGIENCVMIPNGVETDIFKPLSEEERRGIRKKYNIPNEGQVVVNVSRLEHKNGVGDVIEAVRELDDITLVIVGDGSLRNKLEHKARELGISDRVIFLGECDRREVAEIVGASDLFIRTPYSEGFGIVFLEAMAAVVPVVATPVGGITDFIQDEETGIFAKVGDSESIASVIRKVVDNTTLQKDIISNAKEMIHKIYDWDTIASQIESVYRENAKSQPRILITTGLYPPEIGGPATYTKLVEEELTKREWEVDVLAFREVRHLPKVLRHISFALKILSRGRGVNIVYAQDPVSVGLPSAIASRISGIPLVIRIAGDYAWEQARQRFGVKDDIDTFQGKKYDIRTEILRSIQRFSARTAEGIITPSKYFRNLVAGWIENQEKVVHIYNGIETPAVLLGKDEARRELGIPTDAKVLLTSGRLVPWKGFKGVIDVLKRLHQDDSKWRLIILGEGPQEKELRGYVKEHSLEESIFFTGRVDREEMFSYLRASDVFILNTSFESFSFAVVEAMMAGVPVVTTNVCNLPEIIDEGVTGNLTSPDDVMGQYTAVKELVGDRETYMRMQKAAQEKGKMFTIEKSVSELNTHLLTHIR